MSKPEFIITGYQGDVGQQACHWLTEHGFTFYHYDEPFPNKQAHYILLHVAAKHPTDSAEKIWCSNVEFMQDVAKSMRTFCVQAIFFSSTSVYNILPQNDAASRTDTKTNESLYGVSKRLGEVYFQTQFESSLSLRLPAILELRNSRNLMSKLFDKIQLNQDVKLVNSRQPFNRFVSVADVMSFILLQASKKTHACLNIAVQPEMSLAEICRTIKAELQSSSTIIEMPSTNQPPEIVDVSASKTQYCLQTTSVQNVIKNWCRQRNKKC